MMAASGLRSFGILFINQPDEGLMNLTIIITHPRHRNQV